MDVNRDELRRRMLDADAAPRDAAVGWSQALARILDPESGLDSVTTAGLLGVPGRRQVLRLGGVTVLGAALLAACSRDGGTATGTSSSSSSSTASSSSGPVVVNDTTLAKTAASLEALTVATYDAAINSGKITTASVLDVVKLFKDHHQQHLDSLNGVITAAGKAAVTTPNAAVRAAVIDPVVSDPELDEAKLVELAFTTEDLAAQTYVFASTALTNAGWRSTFMTISGVEARHKAILGALIQTKSPAEIIPASFSKADDPLPDGALIG